MNENKVLWIDCKMQQTFKLLFHKSSLKTAKTWLLFGEMVQAEVNGAAQLLKNIKWSFMCQKDD